MNILFYILASISITCLIVESSVFGFIRKFFILYEPQNKRFKDWFMEKMKELITCHQCTGFWVGIFNYIFWNILFYEYFDIKVLIIAIFIMGPIISLISEITYRFKKFLYKEF